MHGFRVNPVLFSSVHYVWPYFLVYYGTSAILHEYHTYQEDLLRSFVTSL